MKLQIPCVILCGGKSSRMGTPKQNLDFGGIPLSHFQAARLQKVFKSVYFSSKIPLINPYNIKTILDKSSDFSPLFGLQSALESLESDIFVISVDSPFFDKESIFKIFNSFNKSAIFAKNTKIHPLLGIYPFSTLKNIKQNIANKEYKLMRLLEAIRAESVEIPLQFTQNLNTKEDYLNALRILKNKG